jgi:alkyl sulfatase BDS1-like metallo-beta-lactamase superfamily hydrolase
MNACPRITTEAVRSIRRRRIGLSLIYRYLHDETMRLANHGHTPLEIAEMIEVPRAITDEWFKRDYYGTINHNVKAVYQRYLGWFDGNPAHLHELPPTDAAAKFVEYMGGADADPTNQVARYLQADALEQLGFQAESGPWRAFYLTGAQELRNGSPNLPGLRGSVSVDVMRAMTATMVLDDCAVKLNGPRAADHACSFTVEFTDRAEAYDVVMSNGVLRHRVTRGSTDTTVRASVETFIHLTSELVSADEAMSSGSLEISGPTEPFATFVSLLDQFDIFFPIIEP